jgi:branched-subunit amino acid transport protein
VSDAWLVVVLVGVATLAMKGFGPVVLGGRPLPARAAGPLELLAPALLAALVLTQTVGGDGTLLLDARLLGVAAAGLALWWRAPILVVVISAAAVTAVARLAV